MQDLDINATSLKFKDDLSFKFYVRKGSSDTRLKATYRNPSKFIKCDIVSDGAHLVSKFLPYTGIRYALPNLLLADKIRTYSARGTQQDRKRENDCTDILFLADRLMMRWCQDTDPHQQSSRQILNCGSLLPERGIKRMASGC